MTKHLAKRDRPKAQTTDGANHPRRRLSPVARFVIGLALLAVAWLLTGIALDTFAQSAMKRRDLTRAIRWSRYASFLQPWNDPLRLTRARAARLTGDLEAWSAQMKPLAAQSTDSAIARELQLGKIQLGDFPDEFHSQMGQMLDQSPADEVAEAFVIGLLAKSDRENARAILDAWKRDEPQNPQVEYVEALFQESLDNRRDATARLAKFLAEHPQHEPARMRLANILLADRRYEDALEQLEAISTQDDDFPSTLIKLARCHRLLGNAEKAKALLDPIAQASASALLAVDREGVLRELAQCQLELGEYAQAAQTLRAGGVENLLPADLSLLALADYLGGNPEAAHSYYSAIDKNRQLQHRRADLETYLLVNPDDEQARRELNQLLRAGGK